MATAKETVKKVLVTQTRSGNRCPKDQRRTLDALGLGRIGKSKQHNWTQSTQGMVRAVTHLVEVVEAPK